MSSYTFIKLESGNLNHLYTLFAAVYHKPCPKEYFHLKYATQYTGAEYIGFFALENNVPVAYYGVVPTIVSISKQRVLAAQSCDTMTHPAHTKKGLFTELAKRTFELAKQKGIHFVFGFPNQNSYPGFIKHLGFTHTETMNRYTIHLSNTPFKLLYRKLGLASLKQKAGFIENGLLQEGYDGVIYDNHYVAYKTYNSSGIVIEKGQSFWINNSKGTWVGAIFPLKKEPFLITVKTIESITKASSVTFMISPGTPIDSALSKTKKAEKGFAVILKNLSGQYNLGRLKFQFSDIDIF